MLTQSSLWTEAPLQGVGLGLRECHIPYILTHWPAIPWFEIVADNYLAEGGPIFDSLAALRDYYPMAMHSVGLSLGSTDPLNKTYLNKLKRLANWLKPTVISDHLCWVSHNQQYFHELLPLPYTEEALLHVAERIKRVQNELGQRIAIENVSSYLTYQSSVMEEWTFLASVAQQADCYILLDINNIYVSAYNHHFEPDSYLKAIPDERVQQMHLAGFETKQGYLLDGHNQAVHEHVWALYHQALKRFGPKPTLIEWDQNIPDFTRLQAEANKAQRIMDEIEADRHEQFT